MATPHSALVEFPFWWLEYGNEKRSGVVRDGAAISQTFATRMRRKSIARAFGVLSVAFAVAACIFWYAGHRPIAYHNTNLRDAIGTATQVELSLVPQYGPDGFLLESDPPLVITDRSEIDRMLSLFELPWHLRASDRFHECDGHLVVLVIMPDSREYKIQYDHGKGIYPIYVDEAFPGFCDLPGQACDQLNQIFFGLGFSQDDLGISTKGEQGGDGDA